MKQESPTRVNWINQKFDSMDDMVISFLDHLHNDTSHSSQLIADFHEYYLGRHEKPFIPDQNLKRLFFGYLKKDGLLNHLKNCHKDTASIKTKAIFRLFAALLDGTKSHQIDEIKKIWKQ